MHVSRAQLSTYTPLPSRETPPGYSYAERLDSTPGDDLDTIRKAGFQELNRLGKQTAFAGVGSAATKGASFGLGIVAAVRVVSGEVVPGLVLGAVAGGLYLAHRGLEDREASLKASSGEQVQFLRDLDQAQETLTGVPAPYWIYV